MTKSQFNIKISKDLLIKIKRQAMMSGKSLTEHITDLVTKSLSVNDKHNTDLSSVNKINALEERILSLESIVLNREYLSKKLKPFTNSEAINCTKFMRGVFDKELEKRNFECDKIEFVENCPSCFKILSRNESESQHYCLNFILSRIFN